MKYVAPIVIVLIFLAIVVLQGLGFLSVVDQIFNVTWLRVVVIGGFAAIIIAIVVILVQRIKEIKEDDEDDLSKY